MLEKRCDCWKAVIMVKTLSIITLSKVLEVLEVLEGFFWSIVKKFLS